MKTRTLLAATATGLLSLVTASPTLAAGDGLAHYSVHADAVVVNLLDSRDSPCGGPGSVTFDQHLNAGVAATEAGLTDAQVLELLQDDPDGVIRQVTVTTTGSAVYVSGPHTYTGTFTAWFGGQFLANGMYLQTGTFSFRATSETGSHLLLVSGGHDLDGFNGTTKMFTQHDTARGCLS